MNTQESPLTGIFAEENVVIDFGEHEGKSVFEISITEPQFYDYLLQQKNDGNCVIKRDQYKCFRLSMTRQVH